MKKPLIPLNEEKRLDALKSYEILDTKEDGIFDSITRLAATICGTPISLISLIDENRQWFKSKIGLNVNETPRDISFCGHVVYEQKPLIVKNTKEDLRFSDNPLVLSDPKIRFYAGFPLIDSSGFVLGTLCVIDQEPKDLTDYQLDQLQKLSQTAVTLLELYKKANTAQTNEQHWSDIIKEIPSAIIFTDNEFNCTYVNKSWCEISGLTQSQSLGQGWTQCLHSEDERKMFLDQKKPYKNSIELVLRILKKDAPLRFVRAKFTKLNNILQMNDGVLISLQDMSDQMKALDSERQSTRMSTVISNIRQYYIDHSKDQRKFFDFLLARTLEITESSYGFIGEIRKDDTGNKFLKTFSLTDISWDKESSDFFKKNAPEGLEFKNLNTLFGKVILSGAPVLSNNPKNDPRSGGIPPGHPPLNAFLGVPLYHGGKFIAMVGVANRDNGYSEDFLKTLEPFMDVLAEVINAFLLERDLKQTENLSFLYKKSLDKAAIVAMTNLKGKIIYVNEMFCDISGYTEEELIGQDHRIINSGFHDKNFFKNMWETILSGKSWHGEVCNRAKNGSLYWVDTNIISHKDPEGKIEKFIAIRRDITLEKKHKTELEEAYIKAEQATRAKSEFLSTMSHELRTPLNGVIGMTDILLDLPLSVEQKEVAKTIHSCGQNLLMIINDILDFSKIEAGKMELELIETDLSAYTEDFIKSFSYSANKKGVKLNSHIKKAPYKVYVDEGRFGQILSNLISNAIKFTKVGEVNVYLDFELKDDSIKYLLKIQDTGIGIPNGSKERMFKAFSQVQQSNSREFGGTGLGLSITKKILQLMDGSVSFESEFGKGTIFYVDLTLKKGTYIETNKKSSETHAEWALSSGLMTGRVLVAEDNPTNQLVIKRMLEAIGIKGHVVATGSEALDALREADFDLVLMDCQMPEMDGYEATQKIRKSESLPNKIPIIALTANATKDDEKKCYDSGMNAYLSKPINKKLLEKTLRKFIK